MTLRKALALLVACLTAIAVMGLVSQFLGPPVSDTEFRVIPGWVKFLAIVAGIAAARVVFRIIAGNRLPRLPRRSDRETPDQPRVVPVKIECGCGQRYAFVAAPGAGRMMSAVHCPVCGADGTAAANRVIAQALATRKAK